MEYNFDVTVKLSSMTLKHQPIICSEHQVVPGSEQQSVIKSEQQSVIKSEHQSVSNSSTSPVKAGLSRGFSNRSETHAQFNCFPHSFHAFSVASSYQSGNVKSRLYDTYYLCHDLSNPFQNICLFSSKDYNK